MQSKEFEYPILIKEAYLDTYGHVNNAVYLTLFEEARWDFVTQNHYGLRKIQETGIGPTILELKLTFSKELRLRDQVVIKTKITDYVRKICFITQTIWRGDELCCTAEFKLGLFDLHQRKLILPTDEWLKALGVSE